MRSGGMPGFASGSSFGVVKLWIGLTVKGLE